MTQVKIEAGVCGFTTIITAESPDSRNVNLSFTSDCPHVMKAKDELAQVDAYAELFKKPAETTIYQVLVKHLPHTACPLYSGFFKTGEASAGLALPKKATIHFEN